ncbi:MAG: TraX family protein, partial [Candidatus Thiodiazotropha lotti]
MTVSAKSEYAPLSIDSSSISIPSGSLEFVKWFAFLAMIADHVDVYLFNRDLPYLYEIGRLAMPIFAIVLGYNLARPGIYQSQGYLRICRRLFIHGALSVPIVYLLRQNAGLTDPFPLNIMFMLLVTTAFCLLWERGESRDYVMAIFLLLFCGLFVEYFWPGILLGVSVWAYYRYGNWYVLLGVGMPALGLICLLNNNLWAIASIPILMRDE